MNGALVVVMGLDVVVAHLAGVSDGLMVVRLGLIVVFLGVSDVVDLFNESVVGMVESLLVSFHSSSPVLGHSVSVSHSAEGMVSSDDPLVVMSGNLFVVSNGFNHLVYGFLEVSVPSEEHLVSPGSSGLASEVGHRLVTSDSLEVHVLGHPLLSG